jgi:hypothetical protein
MSSRLKIPLILQILPLLIPLNIYVIGDWMGSGIQTLFFRYQQTNIGNSLILLNREIGFVLNGTLTGKSANASVIWSLGVILICIATLVMIYSYLQKEPPFIRYSAFLNAGGALLFTIAIIIQYGITLNGPAGIAIPVGIPILLVISYVQYRSSFIPCEEDEDNKDDFIDNEEKSENTE